MCVHILYSFFTCTVVGAHFSLLQIKTPAQLEAAFSFLSATASDSLKVDEFEVACGVGMSNY